MTTHSKHFQKLQKALEEEARVCHNIHLHFIAACFRKKLISTNLLIGS